MSGGTDRDASKGLDPAVTSSLGGGASGSGNASGTGSGNESGTGSGNPFLKNHVTGFGSNSAWWHVADSDFDPGPFDMTNDEPGAPTSYDEVVDYAGFYEDIRFTSAINGPPSGAIVMIGGVSVGSPVEAPGAIQGMHDGAASSAASEGTGGSSAGESPGDQFTGAGDEEEGNARGGINAATNILPTIMRGFSNPLVDVLSGLVAHLLVDGIPNIAQLGVGHHYVPIQVISEFRSKMTPAARDIALGNTSGPTYPSHRYGRYGGISHAEYNEIVADELKKYMKKNKITKMNADQMYDFSEKMRNGLNHSGNPHEKLKSFNSAVDVQRDAYVNGNQGRGRKTARSKADYESRGKSFRYKQNLFKTAIAGLTFGALDQAISDATGLLDVASKSQNFRLAVKALSEGELALAERYLFGHGNLQYGGFMAELVDNGLARPALVFKAKFYELVAKAKADAQQLLQDDPSEPYDG